MRRISHAPHHICVPLKGVQGLPVVHIPQCDRYATAGEDGLAIWCIDHVCDITYVPLKGVQELPAVRVPQLGCVVVTSRENSFAIWCISYTRHTTRVSQKGD